jgi:hypothetical protein
MRVSGKLWAVAAMGGLVVGLGGCGSAGSSGSTGPAAGTAAQLATHFDSIYTAIIAGGTAADSDQAADVAQFVELAPAYGSPDQAVTLTTTSGTRAWRGLVYDLVSGADSEFIAVVYNDQNLDTMFVTVFPYENEQALPEGTYTTGAFTTLIQDSLTTGGISVASTGASCTRQTGLAADTYFASYLPGATCVTATFNVSFSLMSSAAYADTLGSLGAVSVSNATLSGVQVTLPGGVSYVGSPPTKTAAVLTRVLAMLRRRR